MICISNLCATSESEHLEILVKNGCIDVLCSFLNPDYIGLLESVINGLESVLYYGRIIQEDNEYAENPYWIYLEEKRYLEKLEALVLNNEYSIKVDLINRIEKIVHSYIKSSDIEKI